VAYNWVFGDGSSQITSPTATVSHVYPGKGTYTVTITVTDTVGQTSSASKTITIKKDS